MDRFLNAPIELQRKWKKKAEEEKRKKINYEMNSNPDLLFSDLSDEDDQLSSKKRPKGSLNIDKICKSGSSDFYQPQSPLPGPQAPRSRQEIFGAPILKHSLNVLENKPSPLLRYRYGSLGKEALAQTSSSLFSDEKPRTIPAIKIPEISFKKKNLKKNEIKK